MADDADDDVLDLTEEQQLDDEGEGQSDEPDEGVEELAVVIGDDEAAPASGERDTSTLRQLRERNRELAKELAEARKAAPRAQKVELGPKPTLVDCDYDEERFDREYEAWRQRKAQASEAESQAQQAQREADEAWQKDLSNYAAKKAELKFGDVQDAEDAVTATLDQVQQAVIVKAAEDPALVLYSLGKHPGQLSELAKIKDPLKLAAAVARLEGKLKVVSRRKAPEPEQVVRGSASLSASSNKEEERLEREAERTGDRTKLIAYRKQRKAA